MGNTKKAREHLYLAIEQWPHNPLLYLRLANNYYNAKDYRQARHWLEVASNIDMDNKITSGMSNIQACKAMSAELALKLAFHQEKDIDKAVKYSQMLLSVSPTPENEENHYFLMDKQLANNACKNVVELVRYIKETGDVDSIKGILNSLPDFMKGLEFVTKLKQEILPPRKWARDEICYFANFGGPSIGKWDESSLKQGLGGSETAVIRLAQEWVKMGWKVTVYGDPVTVGERDGINWQPWYEFNWKDNFNIFISWRSWGLSERIKCRKLLIDLHDVYSPVDITKSQINHIDKFMVKSNYHRQLAPLIPDEKFSVTSNGI
jgi:tetratricopeptide (TPR) repeat protein